MVKALFGVILLLSTLLAFADAKLLDHLKSRRNRYALSSQCLLFIQSATKHTFHSAALKAATRKLKDTNLGLHFFHYTNASQVLSTLRSDIVDRELAQQSIVQSRGYKSIIDYQMTYLDALSNLVGVGFYVASNPFSSASYGHWQIDFKLSPESVYLDYQTNTRLVQNHLSELTRRNPYMSYCPDKLKLSLIIDSNDIDIIHYDKDSNWFAIFNEDIFTSSQLLHINRGHVISKMMEAQRFAGLLSSITSLGFETGSSTYGMTLQNLKQYPQWDAQALPFLVREMVNGTPRISQAVNTLMIQSEGTALHDALDILKQQRGGSLDDLFLLPLESASNDFLQIIMDTLTQDIEKGRLWGANFSRNAIHLLKVSDFSFIVNLYNHFGKMQELLSIYQRNDIPNSSRISIINYILANTPQTFRDFSATEKQEFFNLYLKSSTPDDLEQFILKVERLGHNTAESYHLITNNPNTLGATQTAQFIGQYLRLKKDPELLTDVALNAYLAANLTNHFDLLVFIRQNSRRFGERGQNFITQAIPRISLEGIGELCALSARNLITRAETEILLKNILKGAQKGADILEKFLTSFSYTIPDFISIMHNNTQGLSPEVASAAFELIKKDTTLWANYINPLNQNGLISLVSFEPLASSIHKIILENEELFYRNLLHYQSSLGATLTTALFTPALMVKYLTQYGPADFSSLPPDQKSKFKQIYFSFYQHIDAQTRDKYLMNIAEISRDLADMNDLLVLYQRSDLPNTSRINIMNYILNNSPQTFKDLSQNGKYTFFNLYVKSASIVDLQHLILKLEELAYNTIESYNFIATRPRIVGASQAANFINLYIRHKMVPELLTEAAVDTYLSANLTDTMNLVIFIKNNSDSFKVSGQHFIYQALARQNIGIIDNISAQDASLFTKDESVILLATILRGTQQAAIVLEAFLTKFSYTLPELITQMTSQTLSAPVATVAFELIKKDTALWQNYINPLNGSGLTALMRKDHLAPLILGIISANESLFYTHFLHLQNFLSGPLTSTLLKPNSVIKYFTQYAPNDFTGLTDLHKTRIRDLYLGHFHQLSQAIKNKYWPHIVNFSIESDTLSLITAMQLPADFTNQIIKRLSQSNANIQIGIRFYSRTQKSYLLLATTLNDMEVTSNILRYIQANYPIRDINFERNLITNFGQDRNATGPLLDQHVEQFICKKINGYDAFDVFLDRIEERSEFRTWRRRRRSICN